MLRDAARITTWDGHSRLGDATKIDPSNDIARLSNGIITRIGISVADETGWRDENTRCAE